MVYFIAEIGVNFFDIAKKYDIGIIEACKLMIVEAKKSGASCVKFQSYKAETLASKNSPAYWDMTKEKTENQYELFKKYDSLNEEDFCILSNFCKTIDIDFLSTPFDLNSADYLDKYQDKYKISSSDITNYPLLKRCAEKKKPILLSTGASDIEEIKKAVSWLEEHGCPKVIIMHCVLNYPTPDDEANLDMILDIKSNFPGYELGYSDHTCPDSEMLILTTAYLYGAHYIEKHYTLDKTIPGNDHYHSADQYDIKKFIMNIELVNKIKGGSKKKCGKNELKSKLNARRSLVASRELKKGEVLDETNIICKRPGIGVLANRYFEIINKYKCVRDLSSDTIVQLSDIELIE